MKNKKKILLYGGKSTVFIVSEMLKDKKERPKYIYDEYIKNLEFKSQPSSQIKKRPKFVCKKLYPFFYLHRYDGWKVEKFFIKSIY